MLLLVVPPSPLMEVGVPPVPLLLLPLLLAPTAAFRGGPPLLSAMFATSYARVGSQLLQPERQRAGQRQNQHGWLAGPQKWKRLGRKDEPSTKLSKFMLYVI